MVLDTTHYLEYFFGGMILRILNKKEITMHGNIQGRNDVYEILEAGLVAADPYNKTKEMLKIKDNNLIIGNKKCIPNGDPNNKNEIINLSKVGKIYVVGAAKGVQRIAKAIEDVLGETIEEGHVIDKKGAKIELKRIGVTLGGHPVPDNDCIKGCKEILRIAKKAKENDVVFTISGNGVSSLLSLPVEGVNLEDIQKTVYLMQIERGVPTEDLCHIRNHLDIMKGGKVTRFIWPAKAIHLIAFDYNYTDLIYKNLWLHFLPDDLTSFDSAIEMLKKWNAWNRTPDSVKKYLLKGNIQKEVLRSSDFIKYPFRVFCLGTTNEKMLQSAKIKAENLGYSVYILAKLPIPCFLRAEAKEAGLIFATIAKNIEINSQPFKPPCVLLSTGEMVVTVGKEKGVGGRNQEFALAAALKIQGSKRIVIGSVDSDGTDGPGIQFNNKRNIQTLAGGIVDGETVKEADEENIDIFASLRKHDTTPALMKINSGILASQNISLVDLTVVLIK